VERPFSIIAVMTNKPSVSFLSKPDCFETWLLICESFCVSQAQAFLSRFRNVKCLECSGTFHSFSSEIHRAWFCSFSASTALTKLLTQTRTWTKAWNLSSLSKGSRGFENYITLELYLSPRTVGEKLKTAFCKRSMLWAKYFKKTLANYLKLCVPDE